MTSNARPPHLTVAPPQVLCRTAPPDAVEVVVWPGETAARCDLIVLSGALDAAVSAAVGSALRQWSRSSPATAACVDLAGVRFLDAAGLSLLRRLHEDGNRGDGVLQFTRPSPAVRRIVSICGLDELLDVAVAHRHVRCEPVPRRHAYDRHQGHRRSGSPRPHPMRKRS